jgi:hypothetical protein
LSRSAIHDPNDNVRYWAVEALAFLGTARQLSTGHPHFGQQLPVPVE